MNGYVDGDSSEKIGEINISVADLVTALTDARGPQLAGSGRAKVALQPIVDLK